MADQAGAEEPKKLSVLATARRVALAARAPTCARVLSTRRAGARAARGGGWRQAGVPHAARRRGRDLRCVRHSGAACAARRRRACCSRGTRTQLQQPRARVAPRCAAVLTPRSPRTGCEVAVNQRVALSHQKVALFTWHGATVELEGSPDIA